MIVANKGAVSIEGDVLDMLAEVATIAMAMMENGTPERLLRYSFNSGIDFYKQKNPDKCKDATKAEMTFAESLLKAMREEHDA